jgi:hypothetical protein
MNLDADNFTAQELKAGDSIFADLNKFRNYLLTHDYIKYEVVAKKDNLITYKRVYKRKLDIGETVSYTETSSYKNFGFLFNRSLYFIERKKEPEWE